jgi:hypothetical protein
MAAPRTPAPTVAAEPASLNMARGSAANVFSPAPSGNHALLPTPHSVAPAVEGSLAGSPGRTFSPVGNSPSPAVWPSHVPAYAGPANHTPTFVTNSPAPSPTPAQVNVGRAPSSLVAPSNYRGPSVGQAPSGAVGFSHAAPASNVVARASAAAPQAMPTYRAAPAMAPQAAPTYMSPGASAAQVRGAAMPGGGSYAGYGGGRAAGAPY